MNESILVDCERLKFPNTGLFTFCEQLGKHLLKHAENPKLLNFYVPPNYKGIFGDQCNYVIQSPLHKFFQPGTSRFDIWHTTNQVSRYRPFNHKSKVILTIHDLNFLIEKSGRPDKIRKYLSIVRKKIDRAEVIVAISNYVLNQVKAYFNLDDKEQHVIYNGCTFPATEIITAPHYQPQKPFLFSIGTILPKKNFHVLPALLSRNDFELIIAGNVSSKAYQIAIQKEAQKYNVQDRVKIIGPVTENDKNWYYKNCEAFVFPSIAEGFGLPAIEAMYFGKPVFLSKETSLPEIGGDMAFYFESFQADDMRQQLEKGLTNYAMNSLSEKIKSHSLQFSWDRAAKAYLTLYNKMLKS